MRMLLIAAATALAVLPAAAQQVDSAKVDAAVQAAFPSFPAAAGDWRSRLVQDETMKQCSAAHNLPDKAVADAIQARERASIQYPADGKLMGDWKKGEKFAQSGFGLRFTDYPPGNRVNGGNCYACHQISKKEISFGNIGPSLYQYGKLRGQGEEVVKYTWGKLYNAQAYLACSKMPRFGHKGILTEAQLKDVMALLLDPASPVNQ